MEYCEFTVECERCYRTYECKVPIGVPDSLGNIFTEEAFADVKKLHSIQACPMCEIDSVLPRNAVIALSVKGESKEEL